MSVLSLIENESPSGFIVNLEIPKQVKSASPRARHPPPAADDMTVLVLSTTQCWGENLRSQVIYSVHEELLCNPKVGWWGKLDESSNRKRLALHPLLSMRCTWRSPSLAEGDPGDGKASAWAKSSNKSWKVGRCTTPVVAGKEDMMTWKNFEL